MFPTMTGHNFLGNDDPMDNKRLNNRTKVHSTKIEKKASNNAHLISFFLLLYRIDRRNQQNKEPNIINTKTENVV